MRANLVNIAMEICVKIGVYICYVTYDCYKTNIGTMNLLECDLSDISNIKTYCRCPSVDYDVVVFRTRVIYAQRC